MTGTIPSVHRAACCKICGATSAPFGSARVLGRYDVQYYQCPACRFVQTETPHWLDEAYSTALIAADTGAVERNLHLAAITQAVIQHFFDADATFLDYGGGYGLFVRLMRDRGFDFRWYDRYATNLHAIGFDALPNDDAFQLVTAFEVLEHLVDPLRELQAMMPPNAAGLLCTTRLLPSDNPKPGSWWYYAPSGGQHVSLYSLDSLRMLARRMSCYLASDGVALHLFSRRPISERVFRLVTRRRVSSLLNRFRWRASLVEADFERVTGDRLR